MNKNILVGNGQKWMYLKNEQMKLTDLLHADRTLHKLKGDWKFLEWAFLKNGFGQSGSRTLKFTKSQKEQIDLSNFFHAGTNSAKLKVDSIIWMGVVIRPLSLVRPWSLVHETLKSAVSWMNLWIELIFRMLTMMQWFLVRLISYSLTFRYWRSTAIVLLV